MTLLFLKIFIAHLIGDFLLQPDKWVSDKASKKIRSKYLYWHLLVHLLSLLILLSFDSYFLWAMVWIILSHYLIDLAKLYAKDLLNQRWLFLLDQAAHLLVIIGVAYYYHPFQVDLQLVAQPPTLLFIAAILLATIVAGTVMKVIMAQWSLDEDDTNDSLPKAGYYIGILERFFVFTFIVLQQWQAIGFLIAAKSVFRFGDLSKAKDRKLTEYILIGTLLSFGLAILIGLAYNYLAGIYIFD